MPCDPFGYAGKRVVVTGCHSGISAATARLLEAGIHVEGIDRPVDGGFLAQKIARGVVHS